jgi:hypothetical protein
MNPTPKSLVLMFALAACSPEGQVQPLDSDTGTPDTDTPDTDTTPPDPTTLDGDGDGYCAHATECSDGSIPGDCDDTVAAVNPGVNEVCDGADNNCDTVVDTDAVDAKSWYTDGDGDGFGDDTTAQTACTAPAEGMIEQAGDCKDDDAAVNPDALETCNLADDDCNLVVDDVVFDHEIDFCGGQDIDGDGSPDCDEVAGTVESATSVYVDGAGFVANGASYHALVPAGAALSVYRLFDDRLHTCAGSEYTTCTDQWCSDAATATGWDDVQLHYKP